MSEFLDRLPFELACFFEGCEEEVTPVMGAFVQFKSHGEPEAFICEKHLARANQFDQLIGVKLVMTGIEKILVNYDRAFGYEA